MSFRIRDLSVLNYANGFTLWHYKCPTDILDCWKPAYFDGAKEMLAHRDMILISSQGDDAGAMAFIHNDAEGIHLLLMART